MPIKLRELSRFDAADPWRGGRPTGWTITLFRMVPRPLAVSASWKVAGQPPEARGRKGDPGPQGRALARDESVGLEAPDGRYRMLPRALFDRWRAGGVDLTILPTVLNQLEPRLKLVDFRPLPPLLACCILIGILAALLLWLTGMATGAVTLRGIGVSDRPVFQVFALIVLGMILVIAWLFYAPHRRYRKIARLLDEVRP